MIKARSYVLGIFIGLFLLCNPLFLVSCQATNGNGIYLNKIAICNFEVGYRIDIENNIAYVSDNDGVVIINIENPKNPNIIGRISLDDGAFGLVIENDIAYIAGDRSGLVIADVSDPMQPEILGELIGISRGYCIAI